MNIAVSSTRKSTKYVWMVEPFKLKTFSGGWGEVHKISADVDEDGEIYITIHGYQMVSDGSRRRQDAAWRQLIEEHDSIAIWVANQVGSGA